MHASILPRLRLFGIASILVLAASAAMAQTDEKAQSAAKPETAAKSAEKPTAGGKKQAKTGRAGRFRDGGRGQVALQGRRGSGG